MDSNRAGRVVAIFAAVAIAWVVGSDWLMLRFVSEETLAEAGMLKGIAFVLVMAAILYVVLRIAVADVVEAMASHRPYRAGLGIDIALAEIERGAGTLYDLGVAAACVRLFREDGYKIPA